MTDASAEYDLEQEVVRISMADKLRDVVGELPANERQAIELAYFKGYTYRETAALLGEPEGTVKSRIKECTATYADDSGVGGIVGADT